MSVILLELTCEISPVCRRTVYCADREAAKVIVVQLPVPDSESQQNSI